MLKKKILLGSLGAIVTSSLLLPLIINANEDNAASDENQQVANYIPWKPQTAKDHLVTNNQKPAIVTDKYIFTAKTDRIQVSSLAGDLMYEIDVLFLNKASGIQTNQIVRYKYHDNKLFIISSFYDQFGFAANSLLSIVDLSNLEVTKTMLLDVGSNIQINNILSISDNEFLLSSTTSSVLDIFENQKSFFLNKNTLEIQRKQLPQALVNLDKNGLLIDLIKTKRGSEDILLGVVTNSVYFPQITYFSYDGNVSNLSPVNSSDIDTTTGQFSTKPMLLVGQGLEKTEVQRKIPYIDYYSYNSHEFQANNRRYVILSFNSNIKDSISRALAQKFFIVNIDDFTINASLDNKRIAKEPRDDNQKFINFTQSRNQTFIKKDGTSQAQKTSAFNWNDLVPTIANSTTTSTNDFSSSTIVLNNRLFTSLSSNNNDTLTNETANKIFSTTADFQQNTHLTMELKTPAENQTDALFKFGELTAIPQHNAFIKTNNNYQNIIGYSLENNNSNNIRLAKNIATNTVSFSGISADLKNQFPSQLANTLDASNYMQVPSNVTINSKEFIANDKNGVLLLKVNVTAPVWYATTNQTFDLYHAYMGFKAVSDFKLSFIDNSSFLLTNKNLKDKTHSFKNQVPSNVSVDDILKNNIVRSNNANVVLTREMIKLTPNDDNATLDVEVIFDDLSQDLKQKNESFFKKQYTGFNTVNQNSFAWNFSSPTLVSYKDNLASQLTQENAKNLFTAISYAQNPTITLEPNDVNGTLKVIVNLTNPSTNKQSVFETTFEGFRKENEEARVYNANLSYIDNDKLFDYNKQKLTYILNGVNNKYIELEYDQYQKMNDNQFNLVANAPTIKTTRKLIINEGVQEAYFDSFDDFAQLQGNAFKLKSILIYDDLATQTPSTNVTINSIPNDFIEVSNVGEFENKLYPLSLKTYKTLKLDRTLNQHYFDFKLSQYQPKSQDDDFNYGWVAAHLVELNDDLTKSNNLILSKKTRYLENTDLRLYFENVDTTKKYGLYRVWNYTNENDIHPDNEYPIWAYVSQNKEPIIIDNSQPQEEVISLEHINLTPTSTNINVHFRDEINTKKVSVVLANKISNQETKVDINDANSKNLVFNFANLTSRTAYVIKKVLVNDVEIDISDIKENQKNFRTLADENEPLFVNQIIINEVTSNQASIDVEFNKLATTNSLKIQLTNQKDNSTKLYTFGISNSQHLVVDLNELQEDTNYTITSIFNGEQEIDIRILENDQKNFKTTKTPPPTINSINLNSLSSDKITIDLQLSKNSGFEDVTVVLVDDMSNEVLKTIAKQSNSNNYSFVLDNLNQNTRYTIKEIVFNKQQNNDLVIADISKIAPNNKVFLTTSKNKITNITISKANTYKLNPTTNKTTISTILEFDFENQIQQENANSSKIVVADVSNLNNTIEINASFNQQDTNKLTFDTNNLEVNKTYKIIEFKSSKFDAKLNEVEEEQKTFNTNVSNQVQSSTFSAIEKNKATLVLSLANKLFNQNIKIDLINNNTNQIVTRTISLNDTNQLAFDFNNLTQDTQYTLTSLSIEGISLDLSNLNDTSKTFKTLKDENDNLNPNDNQNQLLAEDVIFDAQTKQLTIRLNQQLTSTNNIVLTLFNAQNNQSINLNAKAVNSFDVIYDLNSLSTSIYQITNLNANNNAVNLNNLRANKRSLEIVDNNESTNNNPNQDQPINDQPSNPSNPSTPNQSNNQNNNDKQQQKEIGDLSQKDGWKTAVSLVSISVIIAIISAIWYLFYKVSSKNKKSKK